MPCCDWEGSYVSTTGTNIQTAKKLIEEVINTGRLDQCDLYLAEERIDHTDYGLPRGMADGHEGFKRVLSGFIQAFPDLHLEVEFVVADDDRVVFHVVTTGTHQGPFMGMPATGKSFRANGVDIFRFNADGKVSEHWGVFDVFGVLNQLGLNPLKAPQPAVTQVAV